MFRFPKLSKATSSLMYFNLAVLLLTIYFLNPLITLLLKNEILFGSQPDLLLQDTSKVGSHSVNGAIPRILHQTCATETIPERWRKAQDTCKTVYRHYEYKLWTDDSSREFLAVHYPWFLHAWDNYAFPIQRADAIRYFMMYHYGGIYLDMDTICQEEIPLGQLEVQMEEKHLAIFKPTLPTGLTNDILISTAGHPAFERAILQLPIFYKFTRFWARLQPYTNIMLAAGPLFLTLVVKNYLLLQPSLPSPTIKVLVPAELDIYIADLESKTWHHGDAQFFIWMGRRPWTWFALGLIGFTLAIWVMDLVILRLYKTLKTASRVTETEAAKLGKMA